MKLKLPFSMPKRTAIKGTILFLLIAIWLLGVVLLPVPFGFILFFTPFVIFGIFIFWLLCCVIVEDI
jgi:hypothetical protein